jgi:uncharacterized protein
MTLPSGIAWPLATIEEICRRYEVRELSVFGSAARGEMTEQSDIDLLVDFAPGAKIGLWEFGRLERELQSLLGRKVDLVSKHGLKPRVRQSVLRDAKVVYAA